MPQFYLRRFGTPPGAPQARLVAVDVKTGRRLPAQSVSNLAKVRDFYAFPGDIDDDPNDLENLIAEYEGLWGPALRGLDGDLPVDASDRYAISHFVAFQHIRTSRMREVLSNGRIEMGKFVATMTVKSVRADRGDEGLRQFVREIIKSDEMTDAEIDDLTAILEDATYEERGLRLSVGSEPHLKVLVDALDPDSRLISTIEMREWAVVTAPPGAMFVTSDQPVMLTPWPGIQLAGLGTAREIGLPLSPTRFLVMAAGASGQGPSRPASVSEVRSRNQRTIGTAERWYFMHPETSPRSLVDASTLSTARRAARRRLIR